MQLLSDKKIEQQLSGLGGWERQGKIITLTVTLKNFRDALQFVNEVGELAESMDHHPDILIHGWNKVTLRLSTHSAGGLTQNDFNLATQINGLNRS